MRGYSSQFALEQIKVDYGTFVGGQRQIVPELTNLLVEETNVALNNACLQRAENQVVGRDSFGL